MMNLRKPNFASEKKHYSNEKSINYHDNTSEYDGLCAD